MTDVEADAEPMDAAVQEDESGRKIKGRGHKDASSLEERYANVKFTELAANTPPGPTQSVEGWVLIVAGLNEEAQEEDVHEAFADHGELKNIYMNLDRQTGFAKGYALVEYKTKEGAQAAITALNGSNLLEKKVSVDWAFRKGGAKRA